VKIVIESIPQNKQRYSTLGDWWMDEDGTIQIRVTGDDPSLSENHQFLIALHELVESMLCHERGISTEAVDAFDQSHDEYCGEYDLEPGDLEDCPYRKEHRFAMLIEHLMAHELGISGYGKVM
jgi:hypothetical protein